MDNSNSHNEAGHTIDASFAMLEVCLERLAEIAPVETPRDILVLLPEAPAATQRLILVELIKLDLSAAAESRSPRSLDFYWPAVAEVLPQENIPFDLVLEEVQLRKAAGDEPKWADYRQRFPDLADTIGKWLAGGETADVSGGTGKVPELPIGEKVDDFHVLKQLGQGAFARVYLARQESMQRLVALKATSRGSEEPQALSQLDHANIVRVYDQRELSEPPTILLYMQYLAGGTLADSIKSVRQLPRDQWCGQRLLDAIDTSLLSASQSVPEQSWVREQIAHLSWPEVVAWIGIQLAEGLDYAYEKGVLHRDIKPANILLSGEAVPKLADFNVSCSGLSGRAGAAAYFGGSLAYMSPEQLRVADPTDPMSAEQLDGRSDLYSLGMVLWELWQGRRPWSLNRLVSSWTEAVQVQRELRSHPFETEAPASSPAEKVLEKVLRNLLAVDKEDRPQTGKETAARLRLALYPELAHLFEPPTKSISGVLLSLPVLLVSAVLIFGPNTCASAFNYFYNQDRIYSDFFLTGVAPEMWDSFKIVARWVNGTVFPLGAVLFLMVMLPVASVLKKSRTAAPVSTRDIDRLWNIGNLATLICGILWAVSGLFFAIVFMSLHPEFGAMDAFHFFISLVLCGGVAWTYPYFGMTLLAVLVYYPKVISPTMNDASFHDRRERLMRNSGFYLLSTAAIPLAAIGMLVFRENLPRGIVLGGVVLTLLGLVASYLAHRKLESSLQQLSKVLGERERGMSI